MASAPELASVHDLASASDVASVPDVPSVQDEVSLPDVAPVPNGHSVSNGVSATPSVPDGLGNSPVANGTSVSNGVSATPSVPDGLENSPVANGTSTTSSPSAPANLSIAIIGGGIGGICLAIGLLKHAHINVQIYEAAPKWVQIGAALGFGPNAQAALELLGPETAAAFKKNVTGNLWESHKKTFMNFYAVSFIVALQSSTRIFYSSKKFDTQSVRLRAMVGTPAKQFIPKRAPQDCNLVSV